METEKKKATEKAMSLLLYKDRTQYELTDRLCKAGFSEEAVEEALSYVKSFGYVDDFRYASQFVSLRCDKKSAKEIRAKLREKGISQEIIDQAMQEEYHGEEKAIYDALQKRLKGKKLSSLTKQEKDKHMAYFCRRGYSFHEVQQVFESFEE